MNILHLDSSILGDHSASRQLSAAAAQRIKAAYPDASYSYRDLVADPVPHLSGATLAAAQSPDGHTPSTLDDVAIGNAVMEQFLAADIVIMGVSLYNFAIPSQLKTWVDRIAVAGKTFRYTEQGPEGLVGDKRVIVTIARGGFYGPESPGAAFEHCETYVRAFLGFMGITNPDVVVAEGLAIGPEARTAAISSALEQIKAL